MCKSDQFVLYAGFSTILFYLSSTVAADLKVPLDVGVISVFSSCSQQESYMRNISQNVKLLFQTFKYGTIGCAHIFIIHYTYPTSIQGNLSVPPCLH